MFLPRRVDTPQNSKCAVVGRYTSVVFIYVLFLYVHHSKSQRMFSITDFKVEPPVELMRLRFDLLHNYQKTVRPLRNQKDTFIVRLFYDIYHVVSLDENYQTLTVNGKLKVFWTDEFLMWDPKNYSGITLVHFSPDNIWRPQIIVEYNVKPLTLYEKSRSPPITVYSNGSVQWFPQMRCDVPCSANYKHYPFDNHNCSIIVTPQLYNDSGIALKPYRPNGEGSTVEYEGTEWAVKDVTHEAESGLEGRFFPTHQQVRIRIFLERVSRMYKYICVIPTLISMVTLLLGFWLLPTETSRYLIGCSNIIVLSMLLQHMVVIIPSGGIVPLIAQYSASCLCLSVVFIIVTVIAKLLRECNGKAPDILLRLAHLGVDRCLCIFTFSHLPSKEDSIRKDSTEPVKGSLTPEELQRQKDWQTVSVLADRIFFCCFAFIFVVLLSVLAAV